MKLFARVCSTFFLSFVFICLSSALESSGVRNQHVEAKLISSVDQIAPGENFTLYLQLKIDPTWHTYWVNPGDAGDVPRLQLQLPEGFSAGELQYPIPKKFVIDYGFDTIIAGFGYEFLVNHPIEIQVPSTIQAGETVTIQGAAEWLMCDPNTCVPGKASLSLQLPVGDSSIPAPSLPRANLPEPVDWDTTLREDGDALEIQITVPADETFPGADRFHFYPIDRNLLELTVDTQITRDTGSLTIRAPKSKLLEDSPTDITGVLIAQGVSGKRGFLVSTKKQGEAGAPGPAPDADASTASAAGQTATQSAAGATQGPFGGGLLGMLLGAFLGGIILNIMPCVFPVISLKVMSFVTQSGKDRRKVLLHSLIFALGILVFFWLLTAALLIMRSAGSTDVGWGVQLRQPAFVLILIIVMVLVALSLFGVFEIGAKLTSVGGELAHRSGYAGSFWSGALAVLLATPCTAPLMAPAVAFALTQPALVMIAVFTALALGLALPYLLLAAFPGLLDRIPPPGAWMDIFKQVMGFPMLAVAIWLIGVLSRQLTTSGLQWALLAVLLIAAAAWALGRFARWEASSLQKWRGRGLALCFAVIGLIVGILSVQKRAEATDSQIEEVIAQHRSAGKHVFVDFTAEWCVTCKVNERIAIKTKTVQDAFAANNIEFLIADWTNPDPSISALLEKHGRAGVPLYLLYPADQSKPPIMLPEGPITQRQVLDAIAEVTASK